MEKANWHIIYINKKYLTEDNVERYQNDYNIKLAIPMVWVLRKVSKGKNEYAEVPYLFNMGFLKLPKNRKRDIDFLTKLKKEIPLILGYLRDTTKPKEGFNFAFASTKELNNLIDNANNSSVYDDIDKVINIGDIVEMKGFPWDGLSGKILSLNKEIEKAKVEIIQDTFNIKVDVPFYNICYTQYTSEIEGIDMREEYLEDLSNRKVGKIFATISLNLQEDGSE